MTEQPALIASAPKAALSVSWGTYGISRLLEALGIHTWGDYAGMMAGVVSTLLVIDWFWKKWKLWRASK